MMSPLQKAAAWCARWLGLRPPSTESIAEYDAVRLERRILYSASPLLAGGGWSAGASAAASDSDAASLAAPWSVTLDGRVALAPQQPLISGPADVLATDRLTAYGPNDLAGPVGPPLLVAREFRSHPVPQYAAPIGLATASPVVPPPPLTPDAASGSLAESTVTAWWSGDPAAGEALAGGPTPLAGRTRLILLEEAPAATPPEDLAPAGGEAPQNAQPPADPPPLDPLAEAPPSLLQPALDADFWRPPAAPDAPPPTETAAPPQSAPPPTVAWSRATLSEPRSEPSAGITPSPPRRDLWPFSPPEPEEASPPATAATPAAAAAPAAGDADAETETASPPGDAYQQALLEMRQNLVRSRHNAELAVSAALLGGSVATGFFAHWYVKLLNRHADERPLWQQLDFQAAFDRWRAVHHPTAGAASQARSEEDA